MEKTLTGYNSTDDMGPYDRELIQAYGNVLSDRVNYMQERIASGEYDLPELTQMLYQISNEVRSMQKNTDELYQQIVDAR